MLIRIKNLRLRAIIGLNEWERNKKQDLVINIEIEFDGRQAAKSDDISETANYKLIKDEIVDLVEGSSFCLLETLADRIADLVLQHARIGRVRIEIDKPGALRFCDSVSVACQKEQGNQ